MKNICVLLGIVFEFSISVTNATSAMFSYDDCGSTLTSPKPGSKAPTNSLQVRPVNSQQVPSVLIPRLPLHRDNTGEGVPNREALNKIAKVSNWLEDVNESAEVVEEDGVNGSRAIRSNVEPANKSSELQNSELLIYYYEQDGDGVTLKHLTREGLEADYNSLQPGQTFVVTFKPSIYLSFDGKVLTHSTSLTFWDTIPVIAKIRAWTKWW